MRTTHIILLYHHYIIFYQNIPINILMSHGNNIVDHNLFK